MTLKVTLAVWYFLTHFLGNMTHIKYHMCTCNLEWAWRSFISFRAFRIQVVYILCSTLQDFNWHACVARSLNSPASCNRKHGTCCNASASMYINVVLSSTVYTVQGLSSISALMFLYDNRMDVQLYNKNMFPLFPKVLFHGTQLTWSNTKKEGHFDNWKINTVKVVLVPVFQVGYFVVCNCPYCHREEICFDACN